MTYTVRAQGRLQTPEEFGDIAVRSNPDGSVVRLQRRRAHRARRAQLPADRPRQRPARLRASPSSRRPARTRWRSPTACASRWPSCSERFPTDLEYSYTLDTTLPVSEGIREILITLAEAMVLVILVVFLFLQNWRATLIPMIAVPVSLIGTFVGLPAARLLDQHAVAVRPGAGDRPGRRRRDRRGRGGRASHRGGHGAARRDAQGDGGSVGAGRQHRADPGRGVHPGRRS